MMPGCEASNVPTAPGSMPGGAASRKRRAEAVSRRAAERSISPATRSEAIASARSKPLAKITPAAIAVPTNAKRSVSTCWKLPSMLRLRRSAPASVAVAARFVTMPANATASTSAGRTWTGVTSRRTASYTIRTASTSSVTPFAWAARTSTRRRP